LARVPVYRWRGRLERVLALRERSWGYQSDGGAGPGAPAHLGDRALTPGLRAGTVRLPGGVKVYRMSRGGEAVGGGGGFINYGGADSYSYGALLHAELSRVVGPELVFLDSQSIPAGADFVEQILGRVRQARVVLAVIGSHWLTATGPGGERWLDDPADWIRRGLAEAVTARGRGIPVLTGDTPQATPAR